MINSLPIDINLKENLINTLVDMQATAQENVAFVDKSSDQWAGDIGRDINSTMDMGTNSSIDNALDALNTDTASASGQHPLQASPLLPQNKKQFSGGKGGGGGASTSY